MQGILHQKLVHDLNFAKEDLDFSFRIVNYLMR